MTDCHDSVYFAPSVFLNHGGGPAPILGIEDDLQIAESLRNISKIVDLKRLKAVIVVTAHREEDSVTISSGNQHHLLYDYYNYPPASYKFKYDAPGDPVLAGKIHEAFDKAGIPSTLDEKRGWDHGVFIPMMLINPSADIPIVQVSILNNQNTSQHLNIGKVLYQFRKEAVAIFGSGMSYHNMAELRKAEKVNDRVIVNEIFDSFLNKVLTGDVDAKKEILYWDKVPQGLESHPSGEAEHLMPLIVNIGAGGSSPGRNIFSSVYMHKFILSGFIWDKE
ncbi:unnamed protein product [Parnassius apollo]|uniref:(apollo) hypothetical protein n=1 Tax=Parnassius apollo TaxID=110799 RepID=A0A8S3XD50_PARAO|nr:unnamed protein product [Parnassius apollo]